MWYESKGMYFHMQDELLQHACQKVKIIAIAGLRFLSHSLKVQSTMIPFFGKKEIQSDEKLFFHCFSLPCLSLAGYSWQLFRLFALKESLFSIKNEFGTYADNCSKIERRLADFYEKKYSNLYVEHAFSSPKPRTKFSNCIPDIYIKSKKLIAYMHGCAHHCHLSSKCKYNKNKTRLSVNWQGKQFGEENDKFANTIKFLKERHSDEIKIVKVHWQCSWERFEKRIYKCKGRKPLYDLPNKRLCVRDALVGGRTDYFKVHFNQDLDPTKELKYFDVASLYPHIMTKSFSHGTYEVHLGTYLNNEMNVVDDVLYFGKRPFWGIAQLTILPAYLDIPFLSIRLTKPKRLVYTNCRTCAIRCQKNRCNHSKSERLLHVTLSHFEINFALSLGFEIFQIHEICIWSKQSFIFRDYVHFFARTKIISSPVPPAYNSKEAYCDYVNASMEFPEELKICPTDLEENVYLRALSKSILNLLFGKTVAKSELSKSQIVSDSASLQMYHKKGLLEDIVTTTSKYCHIVIKNTRERKTQKCHSLSGIEICAKARIFMYKMYMKVKGNLFYTDVDSVIFSQTISDPYIFPMSETFGHMKDELAGCSVISFVTLGVKNYAILFKNNQTGELHTMLKLKGISLAPSTVNNFFTFQCYYDELQSFMKTILTESKVLQRRNYTDRAAHLTNNLKKKFLLVTFAHSLLTKRAKILPNFDTLPYGYRNKDCQHKSHVLKL